MDTELWLGLLLLLAFAAAKVVGLIVIVRTVPGAAG